MTKDRLKDWILNLQLRYIQVDSPAPLINSLLNLLNRIYCETSCIDDPCPIINYLDCNLPPFKKPLHSVVEEEECVDISAPCSSSFDFLVTIRLTTKKKVDRFSLIDGVIEDKQTTTPNPTKPTVDYDSGVITDPIYGDTNNPVVDTGQVAIALPILGGVKKKINYFEKNKKGGYCFNVKKYKEDNIKYFPAIVYITVQEKERMNNEYIYTIINKELGYYK